MVMLSATLKQLHNKPPTTSVMAEEINLTASLLQKEEPSQFTDHR